jgi:hypothetical protein
MGRGVTRFFSNDTARRDLGWSPRPLDQALASTVPAFIARERQRVDRLLGQAKTWLFGLALFDLVLGVSAAFVPRLYLAAMHPHFTELHANGPTYLVSRTGVLWLFFAAVEVLGARAHASERAPWVLAVGILRLMDVPADLFYLLRADDLGWLGRASLAFSPAFNLTMGIFLLGVGLRGLRFRQASANLSPARRQS